MNAAENGEAGGASVKVGDRSKEQDDKRGRRNQVQYKSVLVRKILPASELLTHNKASKPPHRVSRYPSPSAAPTGGTKTSSQRTSERLPPRQPLYMNHTHFYRSSGGRGISTSPPRPRCLWAHEAERAGRQGGRLPLYLAGIFARFRAMASSTAFSCFSSSSRRDSVLLGFPEPELDPPAGAEAAGGALLDGVVGIFPEDLIGGDRGRFLREKKIF